MFEEPLSVNDVFVAFVAAMGGGAGAWATIKAVVSYTAKNKEKRYGESRADKDQVIANLEKSLLKAEEEYRLLQERYEASGVRIEALLERSNKAEIEQARLETELKYLEIRAKDSEERNKELKMIIDSMAGKPNE